MEDVKVAVLDEEHTDDEPSFVCPAECLRCCQGRSQISWFFIDRSHFKCITRTEDDVTHIPGHFCDEPEPRNSDPLETKRRCEFQGSYRSRHFRELSACTNTNLNREEASVHNSGSSRLTNGEGNVPAGTRCVLPFQYEGVEHVDCIGSRYGGFGWCSTGSYSYENAQEWGGCERPVRVVKAWRAPPAGVVPSAAWPENEYLPEASGPQIGICLSGGGSRSFSASFGALRGLHDLGILQRARYITGVSGGSWATSVYTFAQTSASDEVLLGESWEPEEITLEKLDEIDSQSGRNAPVGYDAAAWMAASALADAAVIHPDADRIYEGIVNQRFLEPYGVPFDSLMTWDSRSLDDVLARNPSLGDRHWVMPKQNRPYPIVETVLAGPRDLRPEPLEKRRFTQAEVTPLYIGRALTSNVTYEQAVTGVRGTVEVGGFIEPIGVGGSEPPASGLPAGESHGTLHVFAPEREFSVGRAIAQSSWAIGATTGQYLAMPDIAMALGYPYWSPESLHPTSTQMVAFDGGCQDNLGIMSLLRRGVERIIMVDNTAIPLASRSEWDPAARLPVNGECDDTIAWLFGVDVDQGALTASWDYTKNQVFAQEDFATHAMQLQDSEAAGRGAVATMRLTTVENEWWGIPAGQVVDLTTVYNSRVTNWEDRLPDEVRQAVFPESGRQSREWENFPHLSTTLAFGKQQVNLLGTLISSAVKMNAEHAFADLL